MDIQTKMEHGQYGMQVWSSEKLEPCGTNLVVITMKVMVNAMRLAEITQELNEERRKEV